MHPGAKGNNTSGRMPNQLTRRAPHLRQPASRGSLHLTCEGNAPPPPPRAKRDVTMPPIKNMQHRSHPSLLYRPCFNEHITRSCAVPWVVVRHPRHAAEGHPRHSGAPHPLYPAQHLQCDCNCPSCQHVNDILPVHMKGDFSNATERPLNIILGASLGEYWRVLRWRWHIAPPSTALECTAQG
jgi:hypothetical protein